MRQLSRSVGAAALIAGVFWLGTLLHEAGHAASAMLFGARLTYLNILWLDLIPSVRWNPLPGYFGYMRYEGDLTPIQQEVVGLAGSLSTLLVAVAAQMILWLTQPRKGVARLVALTGCFFWLDMLTHTLPTLGVPAYLLFGVAETTPRAEAYLAAVALGMPGLLFQAFAIGLSAGLLALTLICWRRLRRTDASEAGVTQPG